MKKILVTALIMMSLTAYAAESGKQVAAKFNDYSISYVLPKTVIDDIEYLSYYDYYHSGINSTGNKNYVEKIDTEPPNLSAF